MKKVLFSLLLCIPLSVFAQQFDYFSFLDEPFDNSSYTLINENAIPKNVKFSNVKQWVAKTFGDYKSVLQYEDPENCKIIIKGIVGMEKYTYYVNEKRVVGKPDLSFTLTIDCKDDKYRLKFENMTVDLVEDRTVALLKYVTTERTCTLADFVKEGTGQRVSIADAFANLLNSTVESIEQEDDF
ncbi:DUF4468 domain-containing protein [Bacteroides sp. 51]|uniref:DUF4468 domain-containing protein n=1 Tax=Bacteroides sp. 51 TaxID=2302938 RepID=UPI0013D32D4D|nr:DUF4468 domain-containing protein [Bacteroides sp. 51]NDV84892.1 DUF4468 domain-containing protein [Bacteroides sp. 51]